jgi:chitinase
MKTTTLSVLDSRKKILMGFWHNWQPSPGDGYQQGTPTELDLAAIPEAYTVVAVAFMQGAGIPTFRPYRLSTAELRRQVAALHGQGRAVVLSLGGADAQIELHAGQEETLTDEIIRLVETYGFDGINLDLEPFALDAADNKRVVTTALKRVKDYRAKLGEHFVISLTPEFSQLTTTGRYAPYAMALEDYYDFVAPQYYNQGGDGIWVDELGMWVAQNNDERKEDFLYYLTESLAAGTRGYLQVPADKLVIGLPSNPDAAATGYVVDPAAVSRALERLDGAGKSIKGLMTWSINWDGGTNRQGARYDWEFCNRYAALIAG